MYLCTGHNNNTCAETKTNISPMPQARGIDIPMLDSVINYNFSCKPKLFVHRVGEWEIQN